MRLTRRLLALLMAVLMTISLFPLQTFAADGEESVPASQNTAAEQETEAEKQAEEDALPETQGETPEESLPEESPAVEVLMEGTLDTNNTVTYVLTSDGVLTFDGTGTIPTKWGDYQPWYAYRSMITSIVVGEKIRQISSSAGIAPYMPFLGLSNVKDITFRCSSCPSFYDNRVMNALTGLERIFVPQAGYASFAASFSSISGFPSNARIYTLEEADDFVIQGNTLVGYQGSDAAISIPESITVIAKGAFFNCKSLQTVGIPDSVTEIQYGAFKNCSGLTNIVIPNGVKSISNYTFYGCSGLTGNLVIPDSVTSIGEYAFSGCSGLDGSLQLSESITGIGANAFSGCSFTGRLVIPDSVKTIGNNAFQNIYGLASITVGKNTTSCGSAFSGCSGVQEMTFSSLTPPSISTFPSGKLQTIYVPSVAYRDYVAAFSGIIPAGAVLRCSDYSGDFLVDDGTLVAYLGEAEEVVFPTDVTITEVADGAFQNLKTAKSITIPEGVTKIGAKAFQNATALQEISLPLTLSEIGSEAFSGCTSLTAITIPESVTELSAAVFKSSGITAISLPSTMTTIGSEAFSGCVSLASVTLPDGLTALGEKAFYNCSALSGTVSVPGGVKTISANAFYGCSALTGLMLEEGTQSIGDYAFSGCSAMTGELVVPSTVTTIGQNAFYGCSQLTKLTLQEGLQSIGARAFTNCSKLSGTLVIPNSVTRVDMNAFYDCRALTGLVLSEGMTAINNGTFYNCYSLKDEIVIPDQMKYIYPDAFRNCSAVTSFVFGEGLVSITGTARGNYSPFSGCGSVTQLTFLGETVPYIRETSAPFGDMKKLAEIYVPSAAYDDYVSAYQKYVPSTARFRILGASSDFLIENGVLTAYIGGGGDVVIPEGVTEIAENTFKNAKTITSLTLPSTLRVIGDSAFYSCSGLRPSAILRSTTAPV